jgi:hypothetical protein
MPKLRSKQRFIPFQKNDLITLCIKEGTLSQTDIDDFKSVCELINSLFHFQFHRHLETLKHCYSPVNPDADTQTVFPVSETEKQQREAKLIIELKALLDAANFEEITRADLDRALLEESLFKIRLQVDFDDFEHILFFRRGESTQQETLVSWLGLSKKDITFKNYERVVIYVKYKNKAYFKQQGRQNLFFTPGSTLIKLFQNIPSADLEMLFPNTEVRMKTIDKVIIGVPAAVGGVIMLVTKLGATFLFIGALIAFWLGLNDDHVVLDQKSLLGLAAGFGTLGGFLWKQFNNFKNRKIKFMKTLADNLYFKNLDNNTGVFHRLIDAAEQEEGKEIILAYYFLLKAGKALTAEELDIDIELWFQNKQNTPIDFDVPDAIRKLTELDMVEKQGKHYQARSLKHVKTNLNQIWDDHF